MSWTLSQRAQKLTSSAIREILKVTERPEVISFAGGLPSPDTFPVERLRAKARRGADGRAVAGAAVRTDRRLSAAARVDRGALFDGRRAHRSAERAGDDRLAAGPRSARQDADRLGQPSAGRDADVPRRAAGVLAVRAEFRFGAVGRGRARCRRRSTPKLLEGARFLYVLPNFQNPTGRRMPLARRQELREIAKQAGPAAARRRSVRRAVVLRRCGADAAVDDARPGRAHGIVLESARAGTARRVT